MHLTRKVSFVKQTTFSTWRVFTCSKFKRQKRFRVHGITFELKINVLIYVLRLSNTADWNSVDYRIWGLVQERVYRTKPLMICRNA